MVVGDKDDDGDDDGDDHDEDDGGDFRRVGSDVIKQERHVARDCGYIKVTTVQGTRRGCFYRRVDWVVLQRFKLKLMRDTQPMGPSDD